MSGGVGAELTGGDFWRGAATGATVGLLNHLQHKLEEYTYNKKTYTDKGELYSDILLDQAAEQFGIKDIAALAAALDNQGLLSKRFVMEGASSGTSYASKYGSKLLPQQMPKRLPTHFNKSGKMIFTKTLGRFIGRMAGPVGWGVLAYDVGVTFYNTNSIYNNIVK